MSQIDFYSQTIFCSLFFSSLQFPPFCFSLFYILSKLFLHLLSPLPSTMTNPFSLLSRPHFELSLSPPLLLILILEVVGPFAAWIVEILLLQLEQMSPALLGALPSMGSWATGRKDQSECPGTHLIALRG